MTKLARRGVLVTLAGVGLLLMAAILLIESPWAREWLAGQASQRLGGRHVAIGDVDIGWKWPPTVHLEEVTIGNPGWAPHTQMLELEALEATVNTGTLLSGQFALARLHLSQPVIHLARREDGTSNWAGLTGTQEQQSRGGGLPISPDGLRVDDGRLTYRDPSLEAELSVDFRTRGNDSGARELMVEAQGTVQGLPLELSGHGGSPSRALAGNADSAYPLTLQGHLGQLQANFDGRLLDISQPTRLEGQLDISAPQATNLTRMIGRPGLQLPAVELRGQLSHQDQRWSLSEATARLGETRVQGAVSVATGGERPTIDAQLHADRLDVSRWGLFDSDDQAGQPDQQRSGPPIPWDQRLAHQLAPLKNHAARFDLTVERLRYGDSQLGDVALQGSLEAGKLDIERLQATQGQPQDRQRGQGELTARGQVDIREDTLTADLEAQFSQVDMNEALASLGYAGLGTWDGQVGLQLPPHAAAKGNRPTIDAQLNIDHLDLAPLGVTQGAGEAAVRDGEAPGDGAAWDRDLAEGLEPLRRLNAQADLSIGRLSYGNAQLRNVALQGRLEAGRLDVQNLRLEQDQGALTAQGVLSIQPQTLGGDIAAKLSRFDLGEALAPLGNRDLGTLEGRLNVRLEEGELIADNTSVDYRRPAQDLFLHINADAIDLADTSLPGVHLQGHGRHNGKPFEYDLEVGPLFNLRNPDKPYPVQGQITSEQSRLYVDGTIEKPLELGRIRTSFELSGPNPARLNALTGLNFPALPPYELRGELRVSDELVRLLSLEGTFGNSDVSGDVRLRLGKRDMLWATLHSRRLDLDDLAPLTGRAPGVGPGEAASPAQQARARREEGQQGLFSDRQWNLQGLRRMDADVVYSADNVDSEYVPLSDVSLDLTLENGVLTLEPLRTGLGGGTAVAQLRLDAHGQTLDGSLDLSARRVNLTPVLRRAGVPEVAEDSAGTLGGEGRVRFTGGSMDELMASVAGRLELGMSGGRLDMWLIEAVGLDIGETLLIELGDADEVPMRCAYARLEADRGVVSIQQFFISTADSNITGGGQVDLDDERLNLVFEAHPKDPSLLASGSPVRVQGDLTGPRVDVISRELIARGVLSALSALVAPPLAILPWVEPGLDEGAGSGCRQLLDESRGAPSADGG